MSKCPHCAGELRFDIRSQELACDHCGSSFDPYSVNELSEAETDCFDVNIFRCPNCLGELYSTDESATGFCSYCGSSVILESRIAKEKRPAYIIPFQITKEDCIKRLSKHMKTAFFAPHAFRDPEKLDRFRGIYMPYWVYSASFKEPVVMNAKYEYTADNYNYTDYYLVHSNVEANVSGLAHDASSSFAESISEEIAPFPAKELKPFSPSFFSGFYGDVPDVDASVYQDDMIEIIAGAIGGSFQKEIGSKEKVMKDQYLTKICPFLPHDPSDNLRYPIETVARHLKAETAMLPVWFLSFRNGDRLAYAVVNGYTGAISCDLPISRGKFLVASILAAIPLFLLLNAFLILTPAETLSVSILLSMFTSSVFFFNVRKITASEDRTEDRGFRFRKEHDSSEEVSKEIRIDRESLEEGFFDQYRLNMKKVSPDPDGSASVFEPKKRGKKYSSAEIKLRQESFRTGGLKADSMIRKSTDPISDAAEYIPSSGFDPKKREASSAKATELMILLGFTALAILLLVVFLIMILIHFPVYPILILYGLIQIVTTSFIMTKKEYKPRVNIPIRFLSMGPALLGCVLYTMYVFRFGPYVEDELYYIMILGIYLSTLLTLLSILKQLNILSTRPLPWLDRKGGEQNDPE